MYIPYTTAAAANIAAVIADQLINGKNSTSAIVLVAGKKINRFDI